MTVAEVALEAATLTARELDVSVYRHPGWQTRMHYPFRTSVPRLLWHDTVTNSRVSTSRLWELLAEGYTGLPGPIANMGVERDGTMGLISAGGAYHAGEGGPWRNVPRDEGNGYLWGIEVANAGKYSGERWTGIQYDVCMVFSHHFLRLQSEHRYYFLGHKEWTPRKVDPWSIDMSAAREAAQGYRSETQTEPADDLEDFMSELTNDQRNALEALADLGASGVKHLVSFSKEVDRRESSGNGVAAAAIDDHRQRADVGFSGEMYDILAKFITGIEDMNSEPRFLSAVLVAAIREARARGWLIDKNAFGENALYRFENGNLQISTDEGGTWSDVVGESGIVTLSDGGATLECDPEAGVGTSDA